MTRTSTAKTSRAATTPRPSSKPTRPARSAAAKSTRRSTKRPANKPVIARRARTAATKPARKNFVSKRDKAAAMAATGLTGSALVDHRIASLGDWRGELLARLRAVILRADPEVVEEVKWGDVPVWSHDGIVTTGETYKQAVKLTFAKGAALPDPKQLFNAGFGGNTRRAIDFAEGAKIDEAGLIALVRAAVALNVAQAKAKAKR